MKLNNQHIVDKINNRHNERIPSFLFWLGVIVALVLFVGNSLRG